MLSKCVKLCIGTSFNEKLSWWSFLSINIFKSRLIFTLCNINQLRVFFLFLYLSNKLLYNFATNYRTCISTEKGNVHSSEIIDSPIHLYEVIRNGHPSFSYAHTLFNVPFDWGIECGRIDFLLLQYWWLMIIDYYNYQRAGTTMQCAHST